MAISLSELTGASTSGNVLNEVNSYADFLDSVPRLVNKADPSGATDAVQTVATKQPIALPLIDGEGYLFCSGINGNGAVLESPILPSTGDFDLTIDFVWKDTGIGNQDLFGQYDAGYTGRFFIYVTPAGTLNTFWNGGGDHRTGALYSVIEGRRHVARFNRTGNTFSVYLDGSPYYSYTVDSSVPILAIDSTIGNSGSVRATQHFKGAIFSVTEGSNFECDFTSPRIPHGATEFTCETGQVVTVNTSGNNPAKVIKKAVLRYDGVDDFMNGVFGQTVTGGYFFAAFSVNGSGGGPNARIFAVNSTGQPDTDSSGFIYSLQFTSNNDLSYYRGGSWATEWHNDLFDDERGDILHEVKAEGGVQSSKVNDANPKNSTLGSGLFSAEEFRMGADTNGIANPSIDLEYLALFPATLSDSQADQVRNFINNRNSVFLRHDTDGYYFFDGAATDDGQVFSGSGSWNGRIVGSDNGDSNFYISQNTLDDRPTTDGYKITFADNTDHFDIPSTTQAGWQIVGTSLGTFAYKVDSDAITELNLLGNAAVGDGFNFRSVGDLYGIILLPQNATNRDIEEARKLLIDRGASDGASVSSFYAAWYKRRDVVEFRATMPQATDFRYAWKECTSLTSFSTQLPEVTNAQEAWYNNASLSSFTTTDLKNCSNFSGAWQFCTSLTQFPSGAKLGTEATNVNFSNAWRSSGITSFPALDLSSGNNFNSAWQFCSSLTQFPQDAKLGTAVTGTVDFTSAFRSTQLTSFSTPLPTAGNLRYAWLSCVDLRNFNLESLPEAYNLYRSWEGTDLTSFSTSIPKANYLRQAWYGCASLTDFSADVFANWNPSGLTNDIFFYAWDGCTSLTAQSVENILVPIANSGKWATHNGTSGGNALSNPEITITYDVSTGSLTAATLSAIETLNGRGWSVNINNEIIVPNILQLQPAAAYSLRSFDSDADPTVVNVRRSSDGSLSDFTASQVSDGTLTSWVNTDVVQYTSDFSSGVGEWFPTNATVGTTADPTDSSNTVLSATVTSYQSSRIQLSTVSLEIGNSYNVSADVYIPSGNNTVNGVLLLDGFNTAGIFGDGEALPTGQWVTVTGSGIAETTAFRIQLDDLDNDAQGFLDPSSIGDIVYVKNVQVTQTTADGYVTTFYDQSTNGRDSTQSTASAQPLIVENGVLLTDSSGNPAIVGDGVDDTLVHPTLTNELDSSDFLVTAAYKDEVAMGIEGAVPRLYMSQSSMSYNTLGTVGYASQIGRNILSFQVLGNTQEVFGNGISLGTASETQVDIGQSMFNVLRAGSNFSGKPLMEVVVFGNDQSAQRSGIEKNINDYLGIY